MRTSFPGLSLALMLVPGSTFAAEVVAGPVRADVVRVIDGDTLAVTAHIWVGQSLATSVRIRGIDTPELRGRCPGEKALAAAARDLLTELAGPVVRIANVENDKYGGRVVADVASGDGVDLGRAMIERGLARAYDGGARADWCHTASVEG